MTANWSHKPGTPEGVANETRRRSGADALNNGASPQTRPILIRSARFGGAHDDAALVRTLMREYASFLNASVGGEHICVESLEAELAALPGAYAEPAGAVLLAFADDDPAGCVALKPLPIASAPPTERACEMKRLWVRATHQGRQIGRRLAEAIVDMARERGYTAMYLDTMPRSMPAAYSLYRAMDFVPVERYNDNPTLRQVESLEIAWLRREL
jgi:putative acetyltransferase